MTSLKFNPFFLHVTLVEKRGEDVKKDEGGKIGNKVRRVSEQA